MGDKRTKHQGKARRKKTSGGATRTHQGVGPIAYQPLTPNFSCDRPILTPAEDLLGRESFSIALAGAFANWQGQDSLVVALYGARGSGKTSIKNLVVHHLRRQQPDFKVLEFNPWEWSGQDRLFSAFFDEMGQAIGDGGDEEAGEPVTTRWKQYASRLALGGSVLSSAKIVTQALGVPLLSLIIEALSAGTKHGTELAEAVTKVYETSEKEKSLSELKGELAEALSRLEAPLLVILDDLDRLTKEEIGLLFQLIKVNADFPKIVYFLLYDRTIVEEALKDLGGKSGRDYMEKIVQVGFDVPTVNQYQIDKAFFDGLSRILDIKTPRLPFDKDRWDRLYHQGLRPILDTLREVHRFLSAFSIVDPKNWTTG